MRGRPGPAGVGADDVDQGFGVDEFVFLVLYASSGTIYLDINGCGWGRCMPLTAVSTGELSYMDRGLGRPLVGMFAQGRSADWMRYCLCFTILGLVVNGVFENSPAVLIGELVWRWCHSEYLSYTPPKQSTFWGMIVMEIEAESILCHWIAILLGLWRSSLK